MKKIFFFIPAILLTAYYSGLAFGAGAAAVQPILWMGLVLLWGGGLLLSRGFIWGAFCGALPGLMLIYQSTQENTQPFCFDLPLGLALLLFYMFCVCALFQRT